MIQEPTTVNTDKRVFLRLMVKISVYYLIVFGVVALIIAAIPNTLNYLPVGGVSELSGGADLEIQQLEDALLQGDFEEDDFAAVQVADSKFLFDDARNLFVSMLGCILLMLPVTWVNRAIHAEGEHDHSLDETTLVLPTVVAGIVMVVQHSLALAFSLAGIVAGVQFRRALTDTFDTLFIFVAIAVGIAAGIHALDIAAVITVFFSYTALCVCVFGDGLQSQYSVAKRKQKLEEKMELAKLKGQSLDSDPAGKAPK